MPGRRGHTDEPFNNKPDASKYPINDGTVIRFMKPARLYNKKINATVEHWEFLWFLTVFKEPGPAMRRQDRRVRVFRYLVPIEPSLHHLYLYSERLWRYRSLTRALREGFKVISTSCRWHYKQGASKRFYRLVEEELGQRGGIIQ